MATKAEKAAIPPRMSDDAVKAKTGKVWKEWFTILDKAWAKKMTHQEIVACVSKEHGAGPWWQQMVAVTYEQARGLREKHEKPGGYEISVSRTMEVPVSRAYQAWSNEKLRARWLPKKPILVRKATENKTIRITWTDQKSSLEVRFYSKGAHKCQVVAQHGKLATAKAGEKMKAYWIKTLAKLKELVEG